MRGFFMTNNLGFQSLVKQWCLIYEKRIILEFNINIKEVENYQVDLAPIIYCCLLHRKVPIQKWNIICSQNFTSSHWATHDSWLKIKSILEDGKDINNYMSKSLSNWKAIDHLLNTFKIHHFHLRKNKNGGIGDELVFGIFHKDTFYVLGIGNHHDLYKPDYWAKIIITSWPNEILLPSITKSEEFEKNNNFNSQEFKRSANNIALRFNTITPLTISIDGMNYVLNNHQHTNLVNFTLNNICYPEVPIQIYCAYMNEATLLDEIEDQLLKKYGHTLPFHLRIDLSNKRYFIKINNSFYLQHPYPIPINKVTCTYYHTKNYFPYTQYQN